MTEPNSKNAPASSRRDFLKTSTAAAAVASLGVVPSVHAAGSDVIKVGLIGCGGRGTGAAEQSAGSDSNIKIYALADMFPDRIDAAQHNLKKLGGKFDVSSERCFTGFDAYKKLLATDVDLVILATPPGFRPTHIAAAVEAGKHIFTEKPVGVDGPGIRQCLEAAEKAKEKKLAIVAGTQRRHQASYLEAMKRIHDGAIGDVQTARVYWNQGGLWMKPRESSWSDMEWQLRNWLYFTWLSGDHICEQHVHNLDVANWALGNHPVRAVGMGGRQVRTSPAYGHIFDHFAVDYEYPNGTHVLSMCRQIDGCENNVSETVRGTKGEWSSSTNSIKGETKWRFRDKEVNPSDQEHIDLVASIRAGRPLNELRTVAESTLTAIMGRMSAYTGKAITWEDALNSKHKWAPSNLELGASLPVPPVAVPGQSELG
ncbi:MAG: Gfo/Idh/MocA family oxidoreductase [Isosphaeraceae bacterium]|nr:Gfo/Idh/MocA family oxidoreductase [Isosphaeraceae bacterium]